MVWDKLSAKYDGIWLQKYSLTPTRQRAFEIAGRCISADNPQVLDLGCGTGQLLEMLAAQWPNTALTGLDKSPEMLAQAEAKNTEARLVLADAGAGGLMPDRCGIAPGSLDMAICCHSFPYYQNKPEVLRQLAFLLKPEGTALFIQASANSLYDRLCMWVIEQTAEKADYLSVKDFTALVSPHFEVTEHFLIRERFYMASIYGFIMKKRQEQI